MRLSLSSCPHRSADRPQTRSAGPLLLGRQPLAVAFSSACYGFVGPAHLGEHAAHADVLEIRASRRRRISARNSGCSSAIATRPISACEPRVAAAGAAGGFALAGALARPRDADRADARAPLAQQLLAHAEHVGRLARQQIELERIADQPQHLGDALGRSRPLAIDPRAAAACSRRK